MEPRIPGHGSSTTTEHPPLTLLRLPTDIVRSICDFLPLAALLVFRLQTSPRLRNDDALGPLRIGRRGHELSFAEWQEAAGELRKLGLVRADHETSDDEDNGHDGQGERGQRSTKPSQRLPSVPSVAQSQPSTATPARPFRSVDVEPSLGWHGAASLAPKAYKLEVALGVMMATGPAYEARLFRRVIAFLGLISPSNALPPKRAARIDRKKPPKLTTPLPDLLGRSALSVHSSETGLKTIVAISWNGISGETLLHLLRTEETFANVSLIIKTDRFDGEAWKEYRVGRRQEHATLSGKAELDQDAEEENDDAKAPLPYVEAQMMVDVGSRAAKHVNIKGRGFSAGYRSFCFAGSQVRPASPLALALESASASSTTTTTPSSSSSEDVGSVSAPAPASLESDPDGVDNTSSGPRQQQERKPLHVLFQGRMELDEAIETEEMFALSTMRCSACRNTIEM